MQETQAIKRLLPLLKLYPWGVPAIIILGILSSLSEGLGISLFIPFLQNLESTSSQASNANFLGGFLGRFFVDLPHSSQLIVIPLTIFGCVLIKNILAYSNSLLSYWIYFGIAHHIITGIFHQFLDVSYSFLDSKQSGKLLTTLQHETWRTCEAILLLLNLVINGCTIIVFAVLLLLVSWQLTLLVAVALSIISLGIGRVMGGAKKLGQQAVEVNAKLGQLMEEGFHGMRVIRAFGNESYEQKRFEHRSSQVRAAYMKLYKLYAATGPLSETLCVALIVCVLVIALQYKVSIPTLLVFIFMLYRLQPAMKRLDTERVNLVGLTGSVDDVMSLLSRADKPYIYSGHIRVQKLTRSIYFDSVSFGYNTLEKPALQNITISIPRGKTTALVGPSGAGKSTLIGLLCRFYEYTKGEIYVDDYPLRELCLNDWRNQIAFVGQDIYVFNTTVGENIAYGRLDATKEEIIAAAKRANAHEFICKLPQSYETLVGDRGIRLSGGQRQRLALARAIIRNPEILILDEATNALDSASEQLIQEAIQDFSQNRTVIVIAHRLSTIEQADQILVLEEGQVVEQGNLQQLIKQNGLFAKLYNLQHRSAHI